MKKTFASEEVPKEEPKQPEGFDDFKNELDEAKTGEETIAAYNKLASANGKAYAQEVLGIWNGIKDKSKEERNKAFNETFAAMIQKFSRFNDFDTEGKNVRKMINDKLLSLLPTANNEEENIEEQIIKLIKPYLHERIKSKLIAAK